MLNRDITPIFGADAARYYARNLPVIPLHYHEKKPIPQGWSKYHDQLPTPEEQQQWIQFYPNANIGVVLGQQSGLCMIDIDTTNEAVTKVIHAVLEAAHGGRLSPWQRKGAKGMVLGYRFGGVKTFRIKDVHDNMIVEMLSSRTQVVLPPSIHPTTQRPYTATGDLLEMYDSLPTMNPQIEDLLREALKAAGVELSMKGWTRTTDWTPAGTRDVKMTSMAGIYAHGVVRGERSLLEAISMLRSWAEEFTEKVPGDPLDVHKGVQNLISFLVRDVVDKKKVLPRGWDDGLTPEDKENLGLSFKDDHIEWGYDELKDYLHGQFEIHPAGSANRMNAIDYALGKIAKSSNVNCLDMDRIFHYILDAGGLNTNITSLRRRLKELAQGEVSGADHTEIANAVIADITQYAPLKFHAGRFWTWTGANWAEKPQGDIETRIASEYGNLPMARRFSDHKGIVSVIKNLVTSNLKTDPVKGVNFANGFLTQDLKLIPHNPALGMTYTLPFRYLPEEAGKCPKFNDFLHRAWGQDEDYQEKLMALQEAMCATIFGIGPRLQRAILLHGAAKSGKSQLLAIAATLVPDAARSTCPPDSWGDRFAPATMFGKLINVCGELSENKKIDGQRFKSIIDGEEMAGQFKGQQLFQFKPICTHWFASNHLPRTEDTSAGFNRRWLILHFAHPLRNDEPRIANLGEIIAAEEREAIAAWAIEALPRLVAMNEYTIPKSHANLLHDVAVINNSVRFFVLESGRVRIARGGSTSHPISELNLYKAYWLYSSEPGRAGHVSQGMFRMRMIDIASELGFKRRIVRTANGGQEIVYDGLILVDCLVGSKS